MWAQRLHEGFRLSQRTFYAEHISHEGLSFGNACAGDTTGIGVEALLLDTMSISLHRYTGRK